MFNAGHITSNDEGIKFFEKYDVEFKIMKNLDEIRGKSTSRAYNTWKSAESSLKSCGAGRLVDHVDVWEDKAGKAIATLSPYTGMITDELEILMRSFGFVIEYSGCRPYAGVDMIVVKEI